MAVPGSGRIGFPQVSGATVLTDPGQVTHLFVGSTFPGEGHGPPVIAGLIWWTLIRVMGQRSLFSDDANKGS